MSMLCRRRSRLPATAIESLPRVLSAPTFELIPLNDAMDRAAALPPGARVSVTASPVKGLEATVALCEQLQAAGFLAVPHLAARMVRDRAHLRDVMDRLTASGSERVFVVAGDAKQPGQYADALSLLHAIDELGRPPSEIGIACYPQGHPFISDAALLAALREKSAYASYMTTQMCFDPQAIATWVRARRADGMVLPLHIGLPGVTEPHRLLAIGARIGVADTHRFLTKNIRFVARLLRSGGYFRPDGLLDGLSPLIADPAARIANLHLFTFNSTRTTEAWRRRYLRRVAGHQSSRPLSVAGREVR